MTGVRHRVVGGRVLAVPDGACTYCHHDRQRPASGRAPVFHCTDCDRHIGTARIHFLTQPAGPGSDVLCVRCSERRRPEDGPYAAATRAAAANLLGVWP